MPYDHHNFGGVDIDKPAPLDDEHLPGFVDDLTALIDDIGAVLDNYYDGTDIVIGAGGDDDKPPTFNVHVGGHVHNFPALDEYLRHCIHDVVYGPIVIDNGDRVVDNYYTGRDDGPRQRPPDPTAVHRLR